MENRLSEDEKRHVEEHLAGCEMCSDEIEGLELFKDPGQLDDIVRELDRRIDLRKQGAVGIGKRTLLAAAAVIIILAGSVFIFRYMINKDQPPVMSETVSLVKDEPKAIQHIPTAGEEPAAPVPGPQEEMKSQGGGGDSPEPEPVFSGEQPEKPEMKMAETEYVPPGVGGVLALAGDTVSPEQDASMKITLYEEAVYGRLLMQSKGPGSDRFELALTEIDNKEYEKASYLLTGILDEQPENYAAVYYLAYCWHELKQDTKALEILNQFPADSTQEYYPKVIVLKEKILQTGR
jgi:hypothetical protein